MKSPRREITRELVGYLSPLRAADLPAEVVDRVRYLLLDYLGVAIRGSQVESSQAVYAMIARIGASGPSAIVGVNRRALAGYAALANGTAAHACELDDTHNAGSIHLGVVMFPVALALADWLPDIDGGRFFAAVVAGYEAAARIAMAVQPKSHYALGFHPTSTCGVFGAAIAASKLLGLDEKKMLSAVGIAGSMAAGSLEFLAEGAWTKRLHPGLAAQSGIQAALLAAEGFSGPGTILEGRDGFLGAYSKDARPDRIGDNLGTSFEILRTSVKPHACCRYMQAPIDAILDLAWRHRIKPEEVERVEVAVLEAGWPLVVEPQGKKYKPESVVDAQFSMPFGAAMALLHHSAGLDQFTQENARSKDVRRLMGRVVMTKDLRIERNFPEEWPARVEIHLTDGRRFESFVRHPRGDPQNPLTWDDVAAKFQSLASAVLPGDRCDRIEKYARSLVPESDLRGLGALLAP